MYERVLQPVGVELTGFEAAKLDRDVVPFMRELLGDYGVVIMPDQTIDDDTFLAFLRGFGDLAFTAGEKALAGYPDLNIISNVGRTSPPKSTFHVDTSYVSIPPAYTALRAVQIPAEGGETVFTNQYRAFDTLPRRVRTWLAGRTVRHIVTGLTLDDNEQTEADHPSFRVHPLTGKTALYLSTPQRCVSVSGMDQMQSRETVEMLFKHSTRADNIYQHTWAQGDLVIWDNGCVMHKADHSAVTGARVMHRGMVAHYF
jgi:taurine dioxygenase